MGLTLFLDNALSGKRNVLCICIEMRMSTMLRTSIFLVLQFSLLIESGGDREKGPYSGEEKGVSAGIMQLGKCVLPK